MPTQPTGSATVRPMPGIGTILLLCDGNHCRSPMGEALLREALGPGRTVRSAGLSALRDVPPAPEAVQAMAQAGLDISRHRGVQVTAAMALGADLILVMDERQKRDCERQFPSARGRVFLLGHWRQDDQRELPDPFRQGPDAFLQAREHLGRLIADWLPHLLPDRRQA